MAHCTSAVHSLLEHWCEGGVITSHMNILADHFLHELIQRQTQKQKCSYTKFFIGEFRLLKKPDVGTSDWVWQGLASWSEHANTSWLLQLMQDYRAANVTPVVTLPTTSFRINMWYVQGKNLSSIYKRWHAKKTSTYSDPLKKLQIKNISFSFWTEKGSSEFVHQFWAGPTDRLTDGSVDTQVHCFQGKFRVFCIDPKDLKG